MASFIDKELLEKAVRLHGHQRFLGRIARDENVEDYVLEGGFSRVLTC